MDYRTECLFLHKRCRFGKANRNRWLNKRSSITSVTKFGNPATGDKFTTRLFNRIEQADNLVTVPAADQRSDGKTVMLLIPDDDVIGNLSQPTDKFIGARAVYISAFRAEADLTAIEESRPGHTLDHLIHIGVFENQRRVLAA